MGQESRTTRAKHKRRTRRFFRFRKQRGGSAQIEAWVARVIDQPAFPYKIPPQEPYELISLQSDNLTIGQSDNGDFHDLKPTVFAEKTSFYNVAVDLHFILQNILVQGMKPNNFKERIVTMKQTPQADDPQTSSVIRSITFMTDIENALRYAAKKKESDDPEVLTNDNAYPLFIWAVAANVKVDPAELGVPILFPEEPTPDLPEAPAP